MNRHHACFCAVILILSAAGCATSSRSSDPLWGDTSYLYSWRGTSTNVWGTEQDFEVDSGSGFKYPVWTRLEDWNGRQRLALVERTKGVSLVLMFHFGDLDDTLSTTTGTLEAWLFRDNEPLGSRGDLRHVEGFMAQDADTRSNDIRALRLSGEIRVVRAGNQFGTIDVDLVSVDPIPLLRSYFGDPNFPSPLTESWWEQRLASPDTVRATIKGRFEGYKRNMDAPPLT